MVLADVLVDQLPLALDHAALALHEVGERDAGLHTQVDAVQPALAKAGEVERGLAQRLGGDGAGVDHRAARLGRALDDADALAEVRRLSGALLAGGAGADHDEIEVVVLGRDGQISGGAVDASASASSR